LALNISGETRLLLASPFSLVSNGRTSCLLINRVEFIKVCTLAMAEQAGFKFRREQAQLLDTQMIQELYLSKRHWASVKKRTLEKVVQRHKKNTF
jgi:hypothetical protein